MPRSPLKIELRQALNRRKRGERDIVFWPYLGPAGRGLHLVVDPSNGRQELVSSAAGSRTFKPGASVPIGSESGAPGRTILGLPPVDRIGTHETGIPAIALEIAGDPNIVEADPVEIPTGATTAVTLTGFLLGEWIEDAGKLRAVRYEEATEDVIPDPLVTVWNVAFVDTETVTCDVTTDATTPDDYRIRFQVRR